MAHAAAPDVCPCGGLWLSDAGRSKAAPRAFGDCCGRFVGATLPSRPPPDAEALMRSRYTAYVREDVAYLLATWHPSRRPTRLAMEPGRRWLGLELRAHRVVDETHAEVEFVARLRDPGGRASRLHERSRFLREADGRWAYVDGDIIDR